MIPPVPSKAPIILGGLFSYLGRIVTTMKGWVSCNDSWSGPVLSKSTSCAHQWGQYTPARNITHLIPKYLANFVAIVCAKQVGYLLENFVFGKSRHYFAHCGVMVARFCLRLSSKHLAATELQWTVRTCKWRAQETRPLRSNARYKISSQPHLWA